MNRDRREYMRAYKKKQDPLRGERINSKPQCKEFLSKLLQSHPEGLPFKQITTLTMPYEGRLKLSPPRIRGFLMFNGETILEDGLWKYNGDV